MALHLAPRRPRRDSGTHTQMEGVPRLIDDVGAGAGDSDVTAAGHIQSNLMSRHDIEAVDPATAEAQVQAGEVVVRGVVQKLYYGKIGFAADVDVVGDQLE